MDRNGQVLASSMPVKAVWAIPDDVLASRRRKSCAQLAKLLDMPEAELRKKLDSDRTFVYLKRQVEMDVIDQIKKLDIDGLDTRKEYKRFYPQGEVMTHLVGFTNVEDVGQESMELAQQKTLVGATGSRRVIKDRLGHIVEDVGLSKRAARRQGPDPVGRQQAAVHRLHQHQGRGREIPRQGRRRRGARRAHRRSAGAGQLADLQPERPHQADRRAAAQPRA